MKWCGQLRACSTVVRSMLMPTGCKCWSDILRIKTSWAKGSFLRTLRGFTWFCHARSIAIRAQAWKSVQSFTFVDLYKSTANCDWLQQSQMSTVPPLVVVRDSRKCPSSRFAIITWNNPCNKVLLVDPDHLCHQMFKTVAYTSECWPGQEISANKSHSIIAVVRIQVVVGLAGVACNHVRAMWMDDAGHQVGGHHDCLDCWEFRWHSVLEVVHIHSHDLSQFPESWKLQCQVVEFDWHQLPSGQFHLCLKLHPEAVALKHLLWRPAKWSQHTPEVAGSSSNRKNLYTPYTAENLEPKDKGIKFCETRIRHLYQCHWKLPWTMMEHQKSWRCKL